MKKYSVHWINIVVIVIALFMLGIEVIEEIFDPQYHAFLGRHHIPRALWWYIIAYFWYKFLSTAYNIQFFENGSVKTKSFVKNRHIHSSDILMIREYLLFLNIVTDKENISVSTLMDGTSNVKEVLKPLAKGQIDESKNSSLFDFRAIQNINSRQVMRIIFFVLLIIIAVLVEYQQIILRAGK